MRTPDFSGNLRLSLDPTSKLSLYLAGNYIGEADVPHEVVVEGPSRSCRRRTGRA